MVAGWRENTLRVPRSWRQASAGLSSWRQDGGNGVRSTRQGGIDPSFGLNSPTNLPIANIGADPGYSFAGIDRTPWYGEAEAGGSLEDTPLGRQIAAAAASAEGQANTTPGRPSATPGQGTTPGTGGAGWEVQDAWDRSYIKASKETGTPANYLKGVQRIETGGQDYTGQTNCHVPGASDWGGCLALNTGLFEKSVEELGLDFDKVVNDPDYAIYAMGVHMADIANQDAGQYGGTPGTKLVDGGWKDVAHVYFTGDLTDDTDPTGRSFENDYWPSLNGYIEQLGGIGGDGSAEAYGATQDGLGGATGGTGYVADIWGGADVPITQGMGSHEGEVYNNNPTIYDYCAELGVSGHCGVDYGTPYGTPIAAPISGTVVHVGGPYYEDGTGGPGEIRLQADNGDLIIFGHMSAASVQPGQRVEIGDQIGASGQSDSRRESQHLHLEVRVLQPDGTYRAVDPNTYFSGQAESRGSGKVATSQPIISEPVATAPTEERRRKRDQNLEAQVTYA
jgi:murein DD-endopeptidase MepM/ murein hydrolase activator NlpD